MRYGYITRAGRKSRRAATAGEKSLSELFSEMEQKLVATQPLRRYGKLVSPEA